MKELKCNLPDETIEMSGSTEIAQEKNYRDENANIGRKGPIDDRPESVRVCEAIKRYFKARKITFGEIAPQLGVGVASVSNYFSGKTFIPEKIALKLSRLYGFDAYYLINGSEEIVVDPEGNEYLKEHFLISKNSLKATKHSEILLPTTKNECLEIIGMIEDKIKKCQTIIKLQKGQIDRLNLMIAEIEGQMMSVKYGIENINK